MLVEEFGAQLAAIKGAMKLETTISKSEALRNFLVEVWEELVAIGNRHELGSVQLCLNGGIAEVNAGSL